MVILLTNFFRVMIIAVIDLLWIDMAYCAYLIDGAINVYETIFYKPPKLYFKLGNHGVFNNKL